MPPVSAAKPRAQRVPLNYFKKPGHMERWKRVLAASVFGVTIGWVASGAISDRTNERYSHGQLAAKHQQLDANCSACHVDFSPISGKAWNAPFARPASADPQNVQIVAADGKCQACHPYTTLADIHHANQRLESLPSCGSCHRDHRGREVNLSQVADGDCTTCHRNLKEHMTGKPTYHNEVTGFAVAGEAGHPDFRSLKLPDPGVIKFNHELHLNKGIVYIAGAPEWTLGDIRKLNAQEFDRYAKMQKPNDDKAPVKLECAACHEPGNQGFNTWLPSKSEGAYLQPIRYETHCQACHPLRFDDRPEMPGATVKHGQQPSEVVREVLGFYAGQGEKSGLVPRSAPVPLPGRLPTGTKPSTKAQIELALRTLFDGKKGCAECHDYKRQPDGTVALLPNDKTGLIPDGIVPSRIVTGLSAEAKGEGWYQHTPSIPEVWFRHAKFNHKAHRAKPDGTPFESLEANCLFCHADAKKSNNHRDVLIPAIGKCRECHAPADKVNGQAVGGSRYDCTECHNFHHGDDPAGRLTATTLSRAP